jgi:hypothetical protein
MQECREEGEELLTYHFQSIIHNTDTIVESFAINATKRVVTSTSFQLEVALHKIRLHTYMS